MGPSVALDPSRNSRPVLLAVALWRRTGSLHGWQEKEKEVEEGDARQPALSRACIAARRRGTAGVVANGTPADGALSDDLDGRTNDGGDSSDGANGHAHDGRDCRPDDAGAHVNDGSTSDAGGRRVSSASVASNVGDASDGSANDAGVRRVWSASVASNGWRRLRNAS